MQYSDLSRIPWPIFANCLACGNMKEDVIILHILPQREFCYSGADIFWKKWKSQVNLEPSLYIVHM
jgi:hypothetical protein